MYIYLDKQGVVKEIINDEALRQSASNENEIYVYYDGLQEADIGSVLATYGLPDGTITDEMEVATRTEESEIPYNAERDLKYFKYYQAYPFYHFAIADLALSQEGVVRLMIRLAQKDGEYIKVAGLICFDVEGELVKEDHGVSLAQYNYLVKAWVDTKGFLPLDGSKAMQGNIDMGANNVLLNGKTLKDNNGTLNYNGSDLAKQSDTSSLQSQIDTINATQNVVDIVGTKAELNAYVTKDLHANDKIEVLADESQNNANTIYEWNGNAWSLVGSKAPYYSKAESDARYNELKAKSYDKDTASYVSGHVPDSALVKGSLDSVNEKVGALQTDNQTTKTAIAGLVSSDTTNKTNIAKNTQDIATNTQNIENLSAVTPTDINVDSDFNLVLEHDGKVITGQKKLLKLFKYAKNGDFVYDKNIYIYNSSSAKFKEFKYTFNSNDHRVDDGGFQYYENEQNPGTYYSGFNIYIKSSSISYPDSIGFLITKDVQSETCTYSIEYRAQNNPNASRRVTLPTKSGIMALASDIPDVSTLATKEELNTKQATLYHHTITLHNATNTAYFTFSIDRTWQAEITKDTLFNVLNAYIVVGTGIVQNMLIDKISFHNTAEKTKVHQYASFGASGYVNAEVTFASVFGTDYTLEDVTYPLA